MTATGEAPRMRAIFISYRRNDTEGEAGRLFDDLVSEFGENSVFMDVTAIEAGRDFRKAIDESISTCGVLLAIIGKNWVDAKDDSGHRRLDDATDFVRLETAAALRRDIPVIPVIVRGATMPHPEQLPEDVRDLAYRNCAELTHARWTSDVQLLIGTLRRQLGVPKPSPRPPITNIVEAIAARQSSADKAKESPAERTAAPEHREVTGDKKNPLRLFLLLGVCVVAAAMAAYLFIPRQVTLPNLRGDTLADATAKLQALHLNVGHTTLRQDPSVDPNIVLSQSPPSDQQVRRGTAVDLVLSAAIAQVEVPALAGQTLDVASHTLAQHQLNLGELEREARAGVARDIILQQFPKAGEMVKSGSRIDLLVSDTPPTAAATPSTTSAGKTADANWAAQRAAQQAAKNQAALKAAAETAAADKAAADKAAADRAAKPKLSLISASCTATKSGQYEVDLSGDAYAPGSDPYLLYVYVILGNAGTRWRPECKSWSVPQPGEDPLASVTCIRRPGDPSQTLWRTSRLIDGANNQTPSTGGITIFKMGASSGSSLKFNLTCQ